MVRQIDPKIVSRTHFLSYDKLCSNFGYNFKNIELLQEALMHPSAKICVPRKASISSKMDEILNDKIKGSSRKFNYERLEFLGDRVLSFCLGSILFRIFSDDSEGDLSKKYASLACGRVCYEIAKRLEIDKYIVMSVSEEKYDGRSNESNLANAMEAVIGAIFLDAGIDIALDFVKSHWRVHIDGISDWKLVDAKSFLQEWSQMKFHVLPRYETIEISGTEHKPIFKVCVSVDGVDGRFEGIGASKKDAEKSAAKIMIEALGLYKEKI
ncbi:ribonuclease III [Candidatus Deianiraea vastatrix]|uniref:Ribonuclease 3 n=1 Tax=Candidatus Deianiraea vastatrix TaxID=2163644 RepID=A0A5B8XI72_9RICK|nr:ribonuclease III [Candidatus Deianiraea vastatrix]QED23714.1 Ribonuclease 3 [Candidatus Deianiraea vastatrix]